MGSIDYDGELREEERAIHETAHKCAQEVTRPAPMIEDGCNDVLSLVAAESLQRNSLKGSFGKPLTPIRIVDDDGREVAPGEPGELLFQRRGENISSWEVEREIDRHPAVLESAVFGVPSELGEDDVMAVVVLKQGERLDPEDLIRHCEERMAGFMIPRYIRFRDELPKTGTQRVQKSVLKQEGVSPDTWDRESGTG